jgi:hypothetical protein
MWPCWQIAAAHPNKNATWSGSDWSLELEIKKDKQIHTDPDNYMSIYWVLFNQCCGFPKLETHMHPVPKGIPCGSFRFILAYLVLLRSILLNLCLSCLTFAYFVYSEKKGHWFPNVFALYPGLFGIIPVYLKARVCLFMWTNESFPETASHRSLKVT